MEVETKKKIGRFAKGILIAIAIGFFEVLFLRGQAYEPISEFVRTYSRTIVIIAFGSALTIACVKFYGGLTREEGEITKYNIPAIMSVILMIIFCAFEIFYIW